MRPVFRFAVLGGLIVQSLLGEAATLREEARERLREWVIAHAEHGTPTVAPQPNDLARNLVDRLSVANLRQMEAAGLTAAQLPESPWSDSYWPTYAGQIANRYGDPDYNAALIWSDNERYLERMIGRGGDDVQSPAEKYDRLVGDANFTLTRSMIRAGAPYADGNGEVELWFGLCHGWAPASFMIPRPARGVKVIGADGQSIHFRPSDLKALATLLWANAAGATRFVGGRCEQKEPDRDGGYREKDPDCRDTNPATWHLSVVNQIGVAKRSFVMDVSGNNEVWNQPVYSYQYGYVNPITKKSAAKLGDARVSLRDYAEDKYARFRSPEARYVVDIVMSVHYVAETSPSRENLDSAENDVRRAVTYTYDLELGEGGEIVGGEWHSSIHPDFLWLPVRGGKARSDGDRQLEASGDYHTWSGREPLPAAWRRAASVSMRREQPLGRIVERLLAISRERD